jgi:hypothetical protein
MLTNGFTREEIAACGHGTTLNCTKSVVMYETREVTFTAGRTYKVECVNEPLMVIKNDFRNDHIVDAVFFREHFALDKVRSVVHLSETGLHAGRRFCGAARDDGSRSVHAMYAPLQNPEFRGTVCEACLTAWALEGYDEGETMPDYIVEVRQKHKATSASAAVRAAPAPELTLDTQ